MKTPLRLIGFSVLSIPALALAGCSMGFPGDREDCEGAPYVANDVLPDTVTLRVGGPEFKFDLAEAPVFKHTEGKDLSYQTGSKDPSIAQVFNAGSNIAVYPRSAGVTFVDVGVNDDCDKSTGVKFFVRINGL